MSFWTNLFGIKEEKEEDFVTIKVTIPQHNIFIYSNRSKFPYVPLRKNRAYWWSDTGDIHIEGKVQDDGMIDIPDHVLGHELQHTLHRERKDQIAHPHEDED